jgi:phage-related minor tail protein
MARPRKYDATAPATNAERQAAKRARDRQQWIELPRDGYEAHTARLDALQAAIHEAARRGDTTAKACSSAHIETMIELLAAHFESVAL